MSLGFFTYHMGKYQMASVWYKISEQMLSNLNSV